MIIILIVIAILFLAVYLGWESLTDVWNFFIDVKDFANSDRVQDGIDVGKTIVKTVIEDGN